MYHVCNAKYSNNKPRSENFSNGNAPLTQTPKTLPKSRFGKIRCQNTFQRNTSFSNRRYLNIRFKTTFFKKTLSKKFPQWLPHNSRFCRNRSHHKKALKTRSRKYIFSKTRFLLQENKKSPQMRASSTLFLQKCAVLLGTFWGLILFDVHPSANCRDKLAVCGRVGRIHNLATEQLV